MMNKILAPSRFIISFLVIILSVLGPPGDTRYESSIGQILSMGIFWIGLNRHKPQKSAPTIWDLFLIALLMVAMVRFYEGFAIEAFRNHLEQRQ